MSEKMKAAVLHKPGDVRVEEVDRPSPGPGEVLVAMKSVGVCGSDVHFYRTGKIGDYAVKAPMILGHESSGVVAELGEGVRNLQVGSRVAVEPGVPCRRCSFCRSGRYNLCPDVLFYAAPPVDGAFCEFQVAAADFAFPIPDTMSHDEGAMIEPLAVGMHACKRAKVGVGDSAAVLGCGPIGLVTLQAARVHGASPIIAVDIDRGRLALAEKVGATSTVDAATCNAVDEIKRLTGGVGGDVVFETAGVVPTSQQTVDAAKCGGRIVLVGMPEEDSFPMPMIRAICKEVDIFGLFRYANCYPSAIDLVAQGKIDVKSMITKHFPLDEVPKALDFAIEKGRECIKIMIHI